MKLAGKAEVVLHNTMCLIGGFIGVYAIINRGGNLASAQTLNMISIVLALCGRNFIECLIRVVALLIYISGVFLCSILSHKTKINMQRYALTIDMIGFITLCFIPENVNDFFALYPVFFMISTQWSVFHGTNGYNCSTIFSTNNLRQTILAIGDYICTKDRESLKKAGFYANSILCFHIGVAIAYFTSLAFGIYSVLFCFIPALFSMLITFRNSKLFTSVRFGKKKNKKLEEIKN